MRTNSTNIGEIIRIFRKAREISRQELSEMVGISVSHLEKIESGARRPGIDTYQKILEVLEIEIIMRNEVASVQKKCVVKVQEILMNSTESQALFMTNVLECMAQNMELVS